MTGTEPGELLGLGWISFVHPDDLPVRFPNLFSAMILGGRENSI